MANNVNAPTWVPWDPRQSLPYGQQGGVNACMIGWNTLQHVIETTLPQMYVDILEMIG